MNFLVSAVTHLPPIKVAQRKQYKELPSPQVRTSPMFAFPLPRHATVFINDVFVPSVRVRRASRGPTQSTSTNGRSASTPSPTGLATCLWSTPSFAWTPCSLKTKCPSFARSTKTWRGPENKLWSEMVQIWLDKRQTDRVGRPMDRQNGPIAGVQGQGDVGNVPVKAVCNTDNHQTDLRVPS